jgi:hypothetical protein
MRGRMLNEVCSRNMGVAVTMFTPACDSGHKWNESQNLQPTISYSGPPPSRLRKVYMQQADALGFSPS